MFNKNKTSKIAFPILITLLLLAGSIFYLLFPPKKAEAWYNASWSYRKKLTFDNSGQSENLTNFPVLVKLTSSNFDFTKAQSNGKDIRFLDSDDSTTLKYEIEKWDNSGQEAYIWVKIPQIDGSSNTDYIYMYYGNDSAFDNQDAVNVWDSNYVMVQHFQETTGNHLDSTSNNNDTDTVSVTTQGSATGKIGGADDFVRSNSDYVEVPDSASLNLTTYTIEFWINADTPSVATQSLVTRGEDWTNDIAQWVIELDDAQNPDKIQLWYEESNDSDHYYPTNTSISADTWYYFTVTRDELGDENVIYLQGDVEQTNSDTTTPGSVSTPVTIGARRNAPSAIQDYFDGVIDEVRISNSVRSADWVKASYLSSNDSFITFATEEDGTAPSISSAANQTFGVGDSATAISAITITDAVGSPSITTGNDIRIKIPSSFNMEWDTSDITATISGGASSKVSGTVSYEDSNKTLVLDVTSDFAASDSITVSDLSFTNFTATSSADNLELEVANDGSTADEDDKTITIVTPTITVASSTSQPSYIYIPSQDTVLGSASIVRNAGTGSVTEVILKENSGTIDADDDLENIELWLSSDDTWDSGDTQIGSTSNFDGDDGEVTFTESFNVTTTTQYLIVRGDVKSGVTSDKTFELQFKTITTTDTVSGTPLNISGTSTTTPYWWNTNWLYRRKLTFDNSNQSSNLTNFPVLVKLTSSNFDFTKAQSNGEDVRFVDSDNSTSLKYEIEYWDNSGQTAIVWVKIPQIDASSNTDYIYMYYGNSGATDGQNITDVWSNGYVAVYHFAEQSGYYQDSAGTNHANSQQVTSRNNTDANGLGYYPEYVAASGDYVGVPDDTSLQFGSGDFTILVRANASSDLSDTDLIRKGSTNTADPDSWWKLEWGSGVTNQVQWEVRVNGTAKQAQYTKTPDGSWHNFWGTRDTTNTLVELFIDGSQVKSVAGISGSVDPTTSTNIGIGSKDTYNDDHFNGYLDEVRLSNTLRSDDWIATQHNSLTNNLITFGTESVADVTNPTVSTLSPADNATAVTVDSNLVITFSENVDAETGNINLYKTTGDVLVQAFDVTTDITGTGTDTITANPSSNLDGETDYYVKIDATAFDDAAGNSFAGISDTTTWNFTTADETAPTRSNGSPSGTLSSCGVSQTTISLNTDENATCKYSITSGTSYASMANTFSTTGGTSHSQTITGLSNSTYTYYIKCQDDSGNFNTDDYSISFSISACGGGGLPAGAYEPPAPPSSTSENPQGGFKVIINDGTEITNSRKVTLELFAGSDTKRMAISNNPDFSGPGTGQITFQSPYIWDLCYWQKECPDGIYAVYVKYYTKYGYSSDIVSDDIILKTPLKKPISQMTIPELRSEIQTLLAIIDYLQSQIEKLPSKRTAPEAITGIPSDYTFNTNLKYGDQNLQVKYLQIFLKSQGKDIYPEGIVSGWFGPLTKKAVIRFQEKYAKEILAPWSLSSGTGYVGKTTRAKINEILGH